MTRGDGFVQLDEFGKICFAKELFLVIRAVYHFGVTVVTVVIGYNYGSTYNGAA